MRARISRRKFIKTTAAAGSALAGFTVLRWPADAAEFQYKFANNLQLEHPLNHRAQEAVDKIRQESGGRMDIQIFPNNVLGGDTDMFSQLRSGAIDFFTLTGLILSNMVPVTSISGVAFAFKSYDHVWSAMEGPLGALLRNVISQNGLYAFDKMWDNGFRQIISGTKPINAPDDLKGFKIRVPPGPLWTSTFRALGAAPVSINWAETYSALQTKIVDGLENPLSLIEIGKLYEVQKYVSMTGHMWDAWFFLANKRAWEALPKDIREIVERNFNAAAMAERVDVNQLNTSLQAKLESRGMVFNRPDSQLFRAALQKAGYYAEWKAKYGPEAWSLLEKVSGELS